jgi:hypothetical protein
VTGKKDEDAQDTKSDKSAAGGSKGQGDCSSAGEITESPGPACADDDGATSVMINSEPNHQKGESVDGKKEEKSATASEKKPEDKEEKKDDKEEAKPAVKPTINATSNVTWSFQKIGSLDRKAKVELLAKLGSNPKYPLEYAFAMVGMDKQANLTDEEKNFLRPFWKVLYPGDYVEKMLADR